MKKQNLKIGMIAGEHSGDILGAGLMAAIKAQHPNAEFVGIGGPLMIEQGFESQFLMEELSVMGIVEVLGRIFRLLKVRKQIVQFLKDQGIDIFIGIDAPDFNLGVEKRLKAAGIKTVHYVSPSVWAWRQKRVFKVQDATNLVLALLPFEKSFYDKFGIPCEFVGHTLADELPIDPQKGQAREQLGLSADDKVLALLPGSRGTEVSMLAEPFVQSVNLLRENISELKVVVPLVSDKRKAQFIDIVKKHIDINSLILLDGQSREAMRACDAVLISSGTATLEAMLLKAPMVVAYKLKTLTYLIAKQLVNIAYFSLPNLLADQPLVKELLQDEVEPETLASCLYPLLTEDNTALKKKFADIHASIRLNASETAAKAVLKLLEE
ncbi:lipid-A-disaccharide synthase [Algicola sagamiensis]|uniref:lipid-A-disaccharide synthase n=1 Tax=Algicola sagamiensis TaxID=163869 RepID=UPI00036D9ED8|nr:lipid-A-disaccharide synthase [Algicola sagamiensis]